MIAAARNDTANWLRGRELEMVIAVVMGVCGCGKTTVGQALSARLSCEFVDADDWHSTASKEKMARGVPLTDQDRQPWLESLGSLLMQWAREGVSGVLACSALKRSYRDILRYQLQHNEQSCVFILLNGTPDVLAARMAGRSGHFMSPHLLQSQLETLEPPACDELAMSCDIDHQTVDEIVDYVYNQIKT